MAVSKKATAKRQAAKMKSAGTEKQRGTPLWLVAVGASAGGLDALKSFVGGLRHTGEVAYVVAQHVSPKHESLLSELLAPRTEMRVCYLSGSEAPQPDTIYVVPPNYDAEFTESQLRLIEPQSKVGPRPSIDRMFRSLAQSLGERVVGVILSGTGSDGTRGLEAIRERGGTCFVQDPGTAQYDGMPVSAIHAGLADAVLPPEQMGEALADLIQFPYERTEPSARAVEATPELVARIGSVTRASTGVDLASYKRSTIARRLQRRLSALGMNDVQRYADFVEENIDEARQLVSEISVPVTRFYRDVYSFEALRTHLSKLLEQIGLQETLRIWVPGVSTGEEAYTIAFIVSDLLQEKNSPQNWLLFASDIDRDSLNVARLGVYREEAVVSVPESQRERYLEISGGQVSVVKSVRQNMIFAAQNVIEDPPFSKVHLISCRNTLIYFSNESQTRILSAFHYSLRSGGLLMLGNSETADAGRELFEIIDKRGRIFRRMEHSPVFAMTRGSGTRQALTMLRGTRVKEAERRSAVERTRDLIVNTYAPPAVIVDSNDRILHFLGDLAPFVQLPRGPADWLVHDMVSAPINVEVRALIHRARREGTSVRGANYTMEIGGYMRQVTPVAHPNREGDSYLIMLAFEIAELPNVVEGESGISPTLVGELQRELAGTREHLQSVIEEVETSNEELQTLNEELQSSNEELQSTNEELHTSNEELQSANEELLTVNEELAAKTAELEVSRADLYNVKESFDFPMIVVDSNLVVTQLNARAQEVVETESAHPGRSLATMRWREPLPQLMDLVSEVMKDGNSRQRDSEVIGDRHRRLRVAPYVSTGEVRGALIMVQDVTDEVRAARAVRQREALYRIVVQSSAAGMAVLDEKTGFIESNPAMRSMLEADDEAFKGGQLADYAHPEDRRQLLEACTRLAGGRSEHEQFELRLLTVGRREIWVSISAAPINQAEAGQARLIAQLQDVSTRKRRQQRLVEDYTQLRVLNHLSQRMVVQSNDGECELVAVDQLASVFEQTAVFLFHFEPEAGLVLRLARGESVGSLKVGEVLVRSETAQYLRNLRRRGAMSVESRQVGDELDAVAAGARAWIDVAVIVGGHVTRTIRIASEQPRTWSEFEINLVLSVADLLALAERESTANQARDQAARRLAEQRQRAQVTLELISEGVITTDANACIDYMNLAASKLTGWSLEEARGRSTFNVLTIVRGDDERVIGNPLEDCLRTGESREDRGDDLRLIARNGGRRPITWSVAPIPDSEGATIGAMLVVRDMAAWPGSGAEADIADARDALSGLLAREAYEYRLQRALARKAGSRHVIMQFDIAEYSWLSRALGTHGADYLLRRVGERIGAQVRQDDAVARLHDDVFAVLLHGCGEREGRLAAEKIVEAIEADPIQWEEQAIRVRVRVGLAVVVSRRDNAIDALRRLDDACAQSKLGGTTVTVDSDIGDGEEATRSQRIRRVANALQSGGFDVSTLPVVRPDGAVEYQELLLSLAATEGDALSAQNIVECGEHSGLASAIDRWCFTHALPALSGSAAAGKARVALNVSGLSLVSEAFVGAFSEAIADSGREPGDMILEIQEAAARRFGLRLVPTLERLREMGVRIALDRFGSADAAFGLLKQLPLDYVKVSAGFLAETQDGELNRTMLDALQRICEASGIQVVATELDKEALAKDARERGFGLLQGEAVSPAKPVAR